MFSSNATAPSVTSDAKYYESIVAPSVMALSRVNKEARNIYMTYVWMTKHYHLNR